jgi:hypothetical protein
VFYFDECKHKWTEDILLKVLVNLDWDIPAESLFPLVMLAELWGMDLSFPDNDPDMAVALEVTSGANMPTIGPGDFDSPEKPVHKKRGRTAIEERMQEEFSAEHPSSSQEDTVVTNMVLPRMLSSTSQPAQSGTMPPPNNIFIKITVVVRLACGQTSESVLTVARETGPEWPVLLVKKMDWTNMRTIKAMLHKELASSFLLTDSSTKYPLVKLYHWNLVHSSSEPGLHLVILTLHPQFTKYTRRWKPELRFYTPHLLHVFESLDPKWEQLRRYQ